MLALSIFGLRKVPVPMLYVSPMKYDDCSEFDPLPKVKPLLASVLPCARYSPELRIGARQQRAVCRAPLRDRGAPRLHNGEVIGTVLGRDRHGLVERGSGPPVESTACARTESPPGKGRSRMAVVQPQRQWRP